MLIEKSGRDDELPPMNLKEQTETKIRKEKESEINDNKDDEEDEVSKDDEFLQKKRVKKSTSLKKIENPYKVFLFNQKNRRNYEENHSKDTNNKKDIFNNEIIAKLVNYFLFISKTIEDVNFSVEEKLMTECLNYLKEYKMDDPLYFLKVLI